MLFEHVTVGDFMSAIRAARMPFRSFDKMDSHYTGSANGNVQWNPVRIGRNDLALLQNLIKAGDSDAKFMRSIDVSVEIKAPVYWLSELDTYKIATVRNSSSVQHTGAKRDFTKEDFDYKEEFDSEKDEEVMDRFMESMVEAVNYFRGRYKETNVYALFRAMRKCMAMSYEYTVSWHSDYAVLRNIWQQRIKRPHRLKEWTEDFAGFINSLPYSKELITYDG